MCGHKFHRIRKWCEREVFLQGKSQLCKKWWQRVIYLVAREERLAQRDLSPLCLFLINCNERKVNVSGSAECLLSRWVQCCLFHKVLKWELSPQVPLAPVGWLLSLGLTGLSWSFSCSCSGLLGPSLLQPRRVHPRRVPLQPGLGWQQLWDPQDNVLWPVLWAWHLPSREWELHLRPQLDRSRLLQW